MKKKFLFYGFSLSEVLIVMIIVGVIASVSLGILYENKSKEEAAKKYQKTYNVISQALSLSWNQNGDYATWDWGDNLTVRQSFDNYWAPYLKILKYCSSYDDCNYKSLAPWKLSDGVTQSGLGCVNTTDRTTVLLQDGTLLLVRYKNGNKSIYVDLNGGGNLNIECHDFFSFSWSNLSGIVPDLNCGQKIIKSGWHIKDDYPWN